MDHAIDIEGKQGAAAGLALPDDMIAMMGRLVEYVWRRTTAARVAFRRERLDALRDLISQVCLLLLLSARLIARWSRHATDTVEPGSMQPHRHLHHPPQAWAAP